MSLRSILEGLASLSSVANANEKMPVVLTEEEAVPSSDEESKSTSHNRMSRQSSRLTKAK